MLPACPEIRQLKMGVHPIHIAFCVNDAYVPYICVTIKSIAENNRVQKINIHVLTDDISEANRIRLNETINSYANLLLHTHLTDDSPLKGLGTGRLTVHAWYRILLPDILPQNVARVLYLDADTIVTGPMDDLFEMNMADKSIAASLDPASFNDMTYDRCGYDKQKLYICSGIILMNLDYWRQNKLTNKIIEYARLNNKRLLFQDQDAINYICQDTKIILPFQYGTVLWFFCMKELYADRSYYKQLYNSFYHPVIIHYIGCHPWQKENTIRHFMHNEWVKYNKMLKHPVKRTYGIRFSLIVKSWIYRMLHPSKLQTEVSATSVKAKLTSYTPQE